MSFFRNRRGVRIELFCTPGGGVSTTIVLDDVGNLDAVMQSIGRWIETSRRSTIPAAGQLREGTEGDPGEGSDGAP